MSNWNAIRTNQNLGLTDAWKEVNVWIITAYFRQRGWTDNAIAGMLGNMDIESFINPAQSEVGSGLSDTRYGFGLVQWTGTSRISFQDWAGADWETNYDKQLERIMYEYNGGYTQWIPVAEYNYMTFQQFAASTQSPEYLAMAFEKSYERGTPLQSQREAAARKWYNVISGTPTPSGKIPIWLLFKIRWNNFGG
jgi:hypothetical protein